MKLLNIGCGNTRPGSPWTNLDCLHEQHALGTPEREQIDREENYVEHNVLTGPLPFGNDTFSGIALLHVLEHFDAQEGLKLLIECRRVLKPGGIVLVSVPDARYFRGVYPEDRNENWPRLFETTDPKNTIPTFFEAALWFEQHKAILTDDAVWCYLTRAGFAAVAMSETDFWGQSDDERERGCLDALIKQLNRRIFSVEMIGVK